MDKETSSLLKEYQNRIFAAELCERQAVCEELVEATSASDINTQLFRGIIKLITSTLVKYKDEESQQMIYKLIVSMSSHHSDLALENFNSVFKVLCTKELVNAPAEKACVAALVALVWIQHIASNCDFSTDLGKAELSKLVKHQSVLYSLALQTENSKSLQSAYNSLKSLWIDRPKMKESCVKLINKEEASACSVVMLVALVRFEKEANSDQGAAESYRKLLIDHFVKGMITVKTKPSHFLFVASKDFISSLTEEEAITNLLPAIQRSLLRNPETILEGAGYIFDGLNFQLGEKILEIGKILVQNLYSKNDVNRQYAQNSIKQLAQKCNDHECILTLLNQVFSTLTGPEGKSMIAEQRISLLQGAGNLSQYSNHLETIGKILPTVVSNFIKVVEADIQEKVICHGLEMFGLWTIHLSEIDSNLVQWFKKGLTNKSQLVKMSYLQWFSNCLYQAKLPTDQSFIDDLLKIAEKAPQNLNQIPLLCEGLVATCIILSFLSYQNDSHQSFWNIVLDMNKELFFSEKFVSCIGAESLCNVVHMIEKLLSRSFKDLKGSPIRLYKCLIYCATCPHQNVRSKANTSIQKLMFHDNCSLYAENFLNEVTLYLEKEKCDETEFAKNIVQLLESICFVEGASNSLKNIIINGSFLACNHECVLRVDDEIFESLLEFHHLEAGSYISENWNELKTTLFTNYKCNSMYQNSIALISRLTPQIMFPEILYNIIDELKKIVAIGVTDEEYFIFLTPDGELYDKSVMPSNEEENVNQIRRENKAYSYKEQLEEIQIRREIEEKKRLEGKVKEIKLTPKQKEVIKNQLEKESSVRAKLRVINDDLQKYISQIEACVKGNGTYFSLCFSKLLKIILKGLHSPLAALSLSKMYLTLGENVFEDRNFGKSVGLVTVKMYDPKCDLPEDWSKIDIQDLTSSVLASLQQSIGFSYEPVTREVIQKNNCTLYDAPAFAYIFEFLQKILLSKNVSYDELCIGLEIISMHVQMEPESEAEIDKKNPKYLPILDIMRLLNAIIINYDGYIQSKAVATFLETATATSGKYFVGNNFHHEIEFLLTLLENEKFIIRDCGIRALTILYNAFPSVDEDCELKLKIMKRIFVAKHDVLNEIQKIADDYWENAQYEMSEELVNLILQDIIHEESCIQKAAACSLVTVLKTDQSKLKTMIDHLLAIYNEKLVLVPPVLDQFNREIFPAVDLWQARRGVAMSLSQISVFFDLQTAEYIIQFMVSTGLRDREEVVHKEMLAASLIIIELHGKECVASLLPVFEKFLDEAPNKSDFDNIRQGVVILMGSLARHLDKDDKRIQPILNRLLAALATPSQQVQEAVANCIPHLIPVLKDQAPQIVKKLMNQLTKSEKYGERRGAAYGIAGVIKGLGILSLKQLDIMSKLTNHIQDKKNYKCREGALFAFEMLSSMLGRLFEPYIIYVLPHLLTCFGDSSIYVREAADEAAKVVMRKLSAHGVKLVLPSLLTALDDESWRTKIAATELLGVMSNCAPKQLSSCLPTIVPKLMEVLRDSHIKVQEAGANALKMIGSVIKNPEIQAIVPILLKALEDPANKTSSCLQCLLKTKFIHFIDAPSLALIMPVVQRAFLDRSTETRKMSAQIIGNMYSLTDQKDLIPYLDNIMPGLKASLLDPVPEVRTVSAKALGAMVKGMGENSVGEDLLPWLMQTLTSESSPVDRSGAAQGLAEVVAGLGIEKLHQTMPEIIRTAERTDIAPHVKDGYILMFIYMPQAFHEEFTVYIGQIINPILKALADENEYVRDTALKAGQRIVNLYAESAIALLLPELETGLFDDNWRIRYSSIQLLGDLLFKISGVSGKMSTQSASEDDNFGTEQSHKAIIRHLGVERRNRVLAGLYMGRSDVSLMVRQAALHVWKVVVTNTPRTLREILPTLFSLLLGCLGSKVSDDKRQVAARTLGDLVRKLGERILPEIIPILEKGLESECDKQRQGVCIGLSEIMASTSRDMILTFVDSLVSTVRKALSDPLSDVRKAAAKTFDSLHSAIGTKALDDILPSMLNSLSDPDPNVADYTLDGLKQIMAIKSRVVLPYLVPQLTTPPVNTKALSILCQAGEGLTKYLPKILPSILDSLARSHGTPDEMKELEYSQLIIVAVSEDAGIKIIIDTLLEASKSKEIETKKAASALLSGFCVSSPGDYSSYIPQLLHGLLLLFAENDREILMHAWDGLNAVIKTLDSSRQISNINDIRDAVKCASANIPDSTDLPGFALPKGIAPLLPVFREGILNGMPEEKESAAQGIGEVIKLTPAASLQPFVIHITGPLIRILGDRYNSNVKIAVLETLAILLCKVGIMLKQFLPQLATTFIKALNDTNRTVRIKAGTAVSELIKIHAKPDPLFTEIHNGFKNADDSSVRETMLQALRIVMVANGEKIPEIIKKQLYSSLTVMLNFSEDLTRLIAAGCLGALVKWLTPEMQEDCLNNHILNDEFGEDWSLRHGRSAALFVTLKESPSIVYTGKYEAKICKTLVACMQCDKMNIAANGVRGACFLLQYCQNEDVPIPATVLKAYVKTMNHISNDIKQLLAKTSIYLAKAVPDIKTSDEFLKVLIPALVNGTKEKNGYVKSNCEIALISMLRLKSDEKVYDNVLKLLEAGARESLVEVVDKVLYRAIAPLGKDEDIDDTLLT